MPVIYNTAVKTARMTAVRDHFADGWLEILTAADAMLASLGLAAGGGTVAGAVWTLAFDNNTVAASAAGTAAKAQVKRSAANGAAANITGLTVTIAGGGGDVIVDNLNIASGQNVTISAGTITHAA